MATSSLLASAAAAGAAGAQPATFTPIPIPGVNTTTSTKTSTPSITSPLPTPKPVTPTTISQAPNSGLGPYFMSGAQPTPIVGSSSGIRADINSAQNNINSTKTFLANAGAMPAADIPTGTTRATTPSGAPTTPTGTPPGAPAPTPFIPNQTPQKTVNAADLMAGRVDANGNPVQQPSIADPATDPMMDKLEKQFDMLTSLAQDGNLSPDEQARVDAAANAVKAQYDVLIAKAQRAAELGKADALVTAGERGGFLNTQLAGAAALNPTVGRNFVGEGGKLYEISSGYDATIAQLQSEQIGAIQKAREAETEAIRTGNQQKWKQAMDMYNAAADLVTKKNEAQRQKVQALKDALSAKNDDARLALDYQKYQDEREGKMIDNASTLAKTLAPQLVDLDENGNVVAADFNTIASLAEQSGLDPNVLAGSVASYTDTLRKTGLDERRFVFDQNKYASDNLLDQKKLQLEQSKFSHQQRVDAFNQDMKINEFQTKAAGYNLTGEQISDAVKKGYKTESDLALYASQIRQGVKPATLKEKSAEQKKLEANTLSGLNSLSTIEYKMDTSLGRGKLFDGEYKFAESNLVDVLGRLRSGGAITEDEEKRFSGLLPSGLRSDTTNKENLNRLKGLLIDTLGGQDEYNDQKRRVYSDVKTFEVFGDYKDRTAFHEFAAKTAKENPELNIDDPDDSEIVFDEFRKTKGFNGPLSTGVNGSTPLSATYKKYPEGAEGGQCGVFAHKVVDFPPVGNSKAEKFASVDKFGIPAMEWQKNVHVGDVLITNESSKYGHVAVVNKINPDGSVRLTESNFKGKETVSHDRTIPVNSPKIYGAIRGTLKA